MQQHVRVLGILHIVFGALGLLALFVVLAVFGGVMGFLGLQTADRDAVMAIPILGFVAVIVGAVIFFTSIPGIIAGIGLLRYQPWARILTIVLSALGLFNIPFGTALGIYGLWVLLSDEGTRLFERRAVATPAGPVYGIR
jgi:hypothetical protein